MKFLLIVIFFFTISCANNSEQVYICGDKPCANKKEMRDYFQNNISIEVFTIEREKDNKLSLLDLNTPNTKEIISTQVKNKEDVKKIIEKRQKLTKLKLKDNKFKNDKIKTKTKINAKKRRILKKKKSKTVTFVRMCKKSEECDIDKISKIIMDIGKKKSFPDITYEN